MKSSDVGAEGAGVGVGCGPDGVINDDMKELARQLSPLIDTSLDEAGSRTNGGQYDLRLPEQHDGRVIGKGKCCGTSVSEPASLEVGGGSGMIAPDIGECSGRRGLRGIVG
jgi:hypothetical protein